MTRYIYLIEFNPGLSLSGNPPDGEEGEAYSFTFSASGGTSPYTWSVIDGSLPAGLSLGSSTGELSGTPTSGGDSTFTIQVEDSAGATASAEFSVSIEASAGGGAMGAWARKVNRPIDGANVPTVVYIDETALPSEMFDKDGSNPARPRGEDIRVTSDSAGNTLVPHVVLYFRTDDNPANGKAWIAVKPGAASSLWIWYGNSNADALPEDDANGANAVWTAIVSIPSTPDRASQDLSGNARHGRAGVLDDYNSSLIFSAAGEYSAFPSIVKDNDGNLLCAFRRGASDHNVSGDGFVAIYKSLDDGLTWSSLSEINEPDTVNDARDPGLLVRSDGDIWCVYTKRATGGDVVYRISDDGGATWGSEQTIASGNYQSRGKPIELANGNVALSLYDLDGTDEAYYYEWDGASWSSTLIAGSYNETSIIQDPDTASTLYAFLRHVSTGGIYRSVSTDSGSTWGTPSKVINAGDTVPSEPLFLSNGDLLIIWQEGTTIRVAKSTDAGATFTIDSVFAGAAHVETGRYPSMAMIHDGLFGTVHYKQGTPNTVNFSMFRVGADGELVSFSDVGDADLGAEYNGSDRYIAEIGPGTDFNFMHQTGVFTIRGVLKLDNHEDGNVHGLVTSSAASTDRGFGLIWEDRGAASADRELRMYIPKGSSGTPVVDARSDDGSLTDNDQHLIHVIGDGSAVQFYVDGVDKGNVSFTSSLGAGDATRDVNVGRWNHGGAFGYLDGRFKDYVHYSTEMSATEVSGEVDNFSNMTTFWDTTPSPQDA